MCGGSGGSKGGGGGSLSSLRSQMESAASEFESSYTGISREAFQKMSKADQDALKSRVTEKETKFNAAKNAYLSKRDEIRTAKTDQAIKKYMKNNPGKTREDAYWATMMAHLKKSKQS